MARSRVGVALPFLLILFPPSTVAAQRREVLRLPFPNPSHREGAPAPVAPGASGFAAGGDTAVACPRGTPRRHCRRFWVTEAGLAVRLTGVPEGKGRIHGSFEVGPLFSVSPRVGVGIAGFAAFDGELYGGIKPRPRFWLSDRAALDLAAGMAHGEGLESPWIGHVAFFPNDVLGLAVFVHQDLAYDRSDGYGSATQAFLGGKVGGLGGAISGTMGLVAAGVVLAAVLAGGG